MFYVFYFQILSVGNLSPPYVRYSYTKSNLLTSPNYYWRLGEWSNCTEPCIGKGKKLLLFCRMLCDVLQELLVVFST